MGLLDNYKEQVRRYERAGSIGNGLLDSRPDISKGQEGLLAQMQAAEPRYMERVADPLSYYQQNPEAQGLGTVTPIVDLMDLATGGGKATFIGQMAKTFNKKALALAKDMTSKGAGRDEIWRATGGMGSPTFKDVDGKWKQEISDEGFRYTEPESLANSIKGMPEGSDSTLNMIREASDDDLKKFVELQGYEGTPQEWKAQAIKDIYNDMYDITKGKYLTSEVVKHPEFSAAYPDSDLATVKYRNQFLEGEGVRGQFEPATGNSVLKTNNPDAGSVLAHERQHYVQKQEGFAQGGNLDSIERANSVDASNINYFEGAKTDAILAVRKTPEWKGIQEQLNKALGANNKEDIRLWHGARSGLEKSVSKDFDSELMRLYERQKVSPYDKYFNLAGEAEARNVQKRLDYTMDERVNSAPWDTRDVLDKDLTVTGLLGKSDSVKMADSDMARGILELYKTEPLTAIKQAKRSGLLDEIGDQMPRPRGDISNAGELRAKANSDRFADTEYQGQHGAPMAEDNAPLHDLSQVYPSDIYSSKGLQYYGTGNKSIDAESMKVIQSFRGKPDKQITMYRAIPDDIGDVDINAGDWVSLSKQYAKDHGESALNGNYKIISKKAPARQLFTNGDSINEFGFDPSVAK